MQLSSPMMGITSRHFKTKNPIPILNTKREELEYTIKFNIIRRTKAGEITLTLEIEESDPNLSKRIAPSRMINN